MGCQVTDMTTMTDPSAALSVFQAQLDSGHLPLQQCILASDLFVLVDEPNGMLRFTYLRVQDGVTIAIIMLVLVDPIDETPCFQMGYAVQETYRGQGLAKKTIETAITELKNGLTRAQPELSAFYIEAIVSADNEASQHVAASTISADPVSIIDAPSGKPALQYLRKITR